MNMIVSRPPMSRNAQRHDAPQVRIVIVGHVDHGKSTLIGRLLHDTGSLPDGKVETAARPSARGAACRSNGRSCSTRSRPSATRASPSTPRRSISAPRSRDVVLIDAPGHTEFLRNMITGASQADAALLVIDALQGVREQTRRHAYLLHLLGIKQVAVVVNKMDMVDFAQDRFDDIAAEIRPT